MKYVVVGVFAKYKDAEEAVTDLEIAGIKGNEVEVISDPEEDARVSGTPGEPVTTHHEPHHSRFARLFHRGGPLENDDVRTNSGDQPNYIGEQEFYAEHVKEDGAVVVVRVTSDAVANSASVILKNHGGHTPGKNGEVTISRVVGV
jgi:hypothetical protein